MYEDLPNSMKIAQIGSKFRPDAPTYKCQNSGHAVST